MGNVLSCRFVCLVGVLVSACAVPHESKSRTALSAKDAAKPAAKCDACQVWDLSKGKRPPEHCGLRSLVVAVSGADGVFRSVEGLQALLTLEMKLASSKSGVSRTVSLAHFVRKVHRLMGNDDGKGIPVSRTAMQQILLMVEMSTVLESLVDENYSVANIIVRFASTDRQRVTKVLSTLDDAGKDPIDQKSGLSIKNARVANCPDSILPATDVFKSFDSIRTENGNLVVGR